MSLPVMCGECGRAIESPDDTPIDKGDLVLFPSKLIAQWKGQGVKLTAQQFGCLRLILSRSVATKEALYVNVFERLDRDGPDIKIVDVQVCKLRKRLKLIGCEGIIRTEWGRGYSYDPKNAADAKPCGSRKKSLLV